MGIQYLVKQYSGHLILWAGDEWAFEQWEHELWAYNTWAKITVEK